MTAHERYVYEITYDVPDRFREEYETWLRNTTEQWITTAHLGGFSSEQSVMGESPEVRLRLEFETLIDWVSFVESDPYRRRFERLQTMTETLTTHLWEPTSISLNPTADGGAPMSARDTRVTND